MEMFDWQIAEGENADPRPWQVEMTTAPERIDIKATCPDNTQRQVWIEISDGRLVVHGYDPEHDEPVNLRITKTGILVDSDDRPGEKPLNYDTDRYEKIEEFVRQMARLTTPEEELDAAKDEDGVVCIDGMTYDDADEMVSDMSDDRLCDEYGAFMRLVREAKTLA